MEQERPAGSDRSKILLAVDLYDSTAGFRNGESLSLGGRGVQEKEARDGCFSRQSSLLLCGTVRTDDAYRPYDAEGDSLERIEDFITENGLMSMASSLRKHHEIYLSDPRRTALEKLKTVLRLPVEKGCQKSGVWSDPEAKDKEKRE